MSSILWGTLGLISLLGGCEAEVAAEDTPFSQSSPDAMLDKKNKLTTVLRAAFPDVTCRVERLGDQLVVIGQATNDERRREVARFLRAIRPRVVATIQSFESDGPVTMETRVLEIDRVKLHRLGLDLDFSKLARRSVVFGARGTAECHALSNDEAFEKLLAVLVKQEVARVLQAPNVTTRSGRQLYFGFDADAMNRDVDGDAAPSNLTASFDMRCTPWVLPGGRVRQDLQIHVRKPDRARDANEPFGFHGIEGTLESEPNQLAVIAMPGRAVETVEEQANGDREVRRQERSLLIVLRVRQVEQVAQAGH